VFTHPIGASLVAFVLTGILATTFTKWLDNLSQSRELQITLRNRATDSLKEITDVLYERRTRGELLGSSIRRKAPAAEVQARKAAYDDIYVKYNSNLQSNVFRISEIVSEKFDIDLTSSQDLALRTPSILFSVVDSCLTKATDTYLADSGNKDEANYILSGCNTDNDHKLPLRKLNLFVQDCIYTYTSALYSIIRFEGSSEELQKALTDQKRSIESTCTLSELERQQP
jgi:hypothetical protein